jgi:hypothetical protein
VEGEEGIGRASFRFFDAFVSVLFIALTLFMALKRGKINRGKVNRF